MRPLLLALVVGTAIITGCNSGGSGSSALASSAWPRFRHDAAHTGAGIGRVSTARGNPLGVPVDGAAPYSPVVASPALGIDGSAYVVSTGGTLAAVKSNGELKWRTGECEACPDGNTTIGPTLSSPTVFAPPAGATVVYFGSASGRIYGFEDRQTHPACTLCFQATTVRSDLEAVTFTAPVTLFTHVVTGRVTQILAPAGVRSKGSPQETGLVFAITTSGDLLWTYPRTATYPFPFITAAALGAGSTLIFGSGDGWLHAVNVLLGGEPMWTTFVGPFEDPDTPVALAPVTSGSTLFAYTSDGTVVALSASGAVQLWRRKLPATQVAASFALGVQAAVPTPEDTPTPEPTPSPSQPVLPVPTATPSNGAPQPTPTTTATPSPTATATPLSLASSLFIVTKDGRLLVLNSVNGADVRTGDVQQAVDGEVLSSPALSLDSYLVFGSTAGTLYAIDTSSGRSAWPPIALAPGVPLRSSPAVDRDGTIWIGADNGYLYRIGGQ